MASQMGIVELTDVQCADIGWLHNGQVVESAEVHHFTYVVVLAHPKWLLSWNAIIDQWWANP